MGVSGGRSVWEAAPSRERTTYSVPSTVEYGNFSLPRPSGPPPLIPTSLHVKRGHEVPDRDSLYKVEVEATHRGFRELGASTVGPLELQNFLDLLDDKGLYFKVVATVGTYPGFMHKHLIPSTNNASHFIAYSKRKGLLSDFKKAYLSGDHETQGGLLGYARCCVEAFCDLSSIGYIDTMVPYLMQGNDNAYLTPTLRYFGWRVIPFLACSPRCKAALSIARKYAELVNCWWKGVDYRVTVTKGLVIVEASPIKLYSGTVKFPDRLVFEGTYA